MIKHYLYKKIIYFYNKCFILMKKEMLYNDKEKIMKFEKIYCSKKEQYVEDNFIEKRFSKY